MPLRLCGLGARPARETTVETLQALGECDVVYADALEPAVFSWLKKFCRVLEPAPAAAAIVAAARRRLVGVAVWGPAAGSLGLAERVRRGASAAGVACRVYAAISPMGSVFVRSRSFLKCEGCGFDEGWFGAQTYDLETLLSHSPVFSPGLPIIVFARRASTGAWAALRRRLAPLFPARHRVFFDPLGPGEGGMRTLGSLRRLPGRGGVLLVPPAA